MQPTEKFTIETITGVRPWTDSLFSFRTTRDRGYRFVPGQFARIGVVDAASGEKIWRASSIENHWARSISGNCPNFPDRGGHSSANRLLRTVDTSKSDSAAKA